MTLIKIFYHIIHFFGIGKFYKYRLINCVTAEAYICSDFSYIKNVEKTIIRKIKKAYGRVGLILYVYDILEVY